MTQRQQQKIGSNFGPKSEPEEVLAEIDLEGRIAVLTGGYSGIGLETCKALAAAGVRVYVPVRDPDKAATNLEGVKGDVVTVPMDLADLASVQSFADRFLEREQKLDLLINNAGIMACPETRLHGGLEAQFAINHLGHFLLGRSLLPALLHAERPRVVCLSSVGHRRSGMRWDDLQFQQEDYEKWTAYGQSKTANALFARALDVRYGDKGLKAFSVHPGGIMTPLQRHLEQEEMQALGWLNEDGELSDLARQLFKTPSQGCSTTLWAATSPALESYGGQYCEDCDIADLATEDSPRFRDVASWAADDEAAMQLWDVSEHLLASLDFAETPS